MVAAWPCSAGQGSLQGLALSRSSHVSPARGERRPHRSGTLGQLVAHSILGSARRPRSRIGQNSAKISCPLTRLDQNCFSFSDLTDQETQSAGWCMRGGTFHGDTWFLFLFLLLFFSLSLSPRSTLHCSLGGVGMVSDPRVGNWAMFEGTAFSFPPVDQDQQGEKQAEIPRQLDVALRRRFTVQSTGKGTSSSFQFDRFLSRRNKTTRVRKSGRTRLVSTGNGSSLRVKCHCFVLPGRTGQRAGHHRHHLPRLFIRRFNDSVMLFDDDHATWR